MVLGPESVAAVWGETHPYVVPPRKKVLSTLAETLPYQSLLFAQESLYLPDP